MNRPNLDTPPCQVGDRVRLTGPMRNQDSEEIPVEDVPVGNPLLDLIGVGTGTVDWIGQWTSEWTQQISVKWDTGSHLILLPGDSFEVI